MARLRCVGAAAVTALALVALLAAPAQAIAFHLNDMHMGTYDSQSMLQYPEWRVGVFSEDSGAANFAPGRKRAPYVDVDVLITNPPHDFAEAFIYRYEAVESYSQATSSSSSDSAGWHPCRPQGQSQGALLPYGVNPDNARHIYGVPEGISTAPAATDSSGGDGGSGLAPIRLRGRVNISLTGLYVVHINACKQHGGAVLDVSGWHRARMTGHITVVNPYGGVPGQAYGYLPVVLICMVIVQAAVLPLWVAFFGLNTARRRAWYLRQSLPIYQIATTAVIVLGSVAYIFWVIYLGKLNATNDSNLTLYGVAGIVTAIRNTVVRVAAFLFAIGHRIMTTRAKYTVIVAVVGVAHGVLGMVAVGLHGAAGQLTPAHAQIIEGHPEPVVAVGVLAAILALLEFFIVLAIALALRRSLRLLAENVKPIAGAQPNEEATQLMRRRRQLQRIYRWYGILVALTVAAGGVWWLLQVTGGLTFMKRTPATWKLWWLPDMGYEVIHAVALISFVFVTLPTPLNLQALVPGVVVDLEEFEDLKDDASEGAAGPEAAHGGEVSTRDQAAVDYGDDGAGDLDERRVGDNDGDGARIAPRPASRHEGDAVAHPASFGGRRRLYAAGDSATVDNHGADAQEMRRFE